MSYEELRRKVSLLEQEFIEHRVVVREHLKSCDKRGARMERLTWGLASGIAAILTMILKAYFHIGSN